MSQFAPLRQDCIDSDDAKLMAERIERDTADVADAGQAVAETLRDGERPTRDAVARLIAAIECAECSVADTVEPMTEPRFD